MSIRGIIQGLIEAFLDTTTRSRDASHQIRIKSAEFCLGNSSKVCSLYGIVIVIVIVILYNAQNCRQVPFAACTNLDPNIHPLKSNSSLTDQSGEISKYSEQSLMDFPVSKI